MIVITENRTYGIYNTVEVHDNHLWCNGQIVLPFSVIGEYSIIEDNSLMDTPRVSIIVPTEISPRQIRRALSQVGLREAVEAKIAQGNQELKDWWEWSTSFLRDHPLVEQMANQLGVTSSGLDDLWRLGASL